MDAPEPPPIPPPNLPPTLTAASPALPAALPKSNTWAVFSVVFGVCGLLMPLAALAAIVCGHVSLFRIKRSAGQLGGKTASFIGLGTGYFVVVLYSAFALFLFKGADKAAKWAQSVGAASAERELARIPLPNFPELKGWQMLPRSQI